MGTKGLYGLLAMGELVQNFRTNRPMQVKDIAQRQKIPEEYLGQIMVLLKRANLVRGTRGPGGGYQLALSPESITVGQVVKCLEGRPLALDLKAQKNLSAASVIERRLMETWEKAIEASEKVLEEVSLADLCKPEERSQMYYI